MERLSAFQKLHNNGIWICYVQNALKGCLKYIHRGFPTEKMVKRPPRSNVLESTLEKMLPKQPKRNKRSAIVLKLFPPKSIHLFMDVLKDPQCAKSINFSLHLQYKCVRQQSHISAPAGEYHNVVKCQYNLKLVKPPSSAKMEKQSLYGSLKNI